MNRVQSIKKFKQSFVLINNLFLRYFVKIIFLIKYHSKLSKKFEDVAHFLFKFWVINLDVAYHGIYFISITTYHIPIYRNIIVLKNIDFYYFRDLF